MIPDLSLIDGHFMQHEFIVQADMIDMLNERSGFIRRNKRLTWEVVMSYAGIRPRLKKKNKNKNKKTKQNITLNKI